MSVLFDIADPVPGTGRLRKYFYWARFVRELKFLKQGLSNFLPHLYVSLYINRSEFIFCICKCNVSKLYSHSNYIYIFKTFICLNVFIFIFL